MYRLIRFYNQNRKQIGKIIGVILIIIFVLQLLNYSAKQKAKKQNHNIIKDNNNLLSYNNLDMSANKSVLSGNDISQQQQSAIKIIDEFFAYCNEQKIQKAYDLLTEECKEEMYSSIEIFDEMYYQKVLKGKKKNISVENWTGNLYKVTINDDFLATGEYSDKNKMQDYITVKDDKLNINNYVGREILDKEKQREDISIKVIRQDTYMDYIAYTFEITNHSQKAILLDSLENIDTMYIKRSNGTKDTAYSHELSHDNLLVDEGNQKQITIKYYSKFSSTKRIKSIVFSRFMSDDNESAFEIEL